MTFKEFKSIDYYEGMPMESVLADVLYKGLMNVNDVLCAYSAAIERDRHENKMRFEEACVCLTQHLSGNFKGLDRDKLNKRMIAILNKSKTFPSHLYDKEYGYTKKDEQEWEEFYKTIYGNI